MKQEIPLLSKSKFMAGLQCYKRLYLELYHSDLADPISAATQAIFDAGHEVGKLATQLYPGGVLVAEDHLHHKGAVASTEKLLADISIPALFEAAFTYDDIRVRVDILVRAGDGLYDMIEVKSSSQLKDEYYPDVAVQLYVLEGCGIKVRNASLCHLNKEYVYPGGEYDLRQLFVIEDITDEVRELLPNIPALLEEMRLPLWGEEPPDIEPIKQCGKPNACPFIGHCCAGQPEHYIGQLPYIRENKIVALKEMGIEEIGGIPSDFPLSANQQRVRECVVNDCVHMDPQLPKLLQTVEYPVHFLDFETFSPALPLFVGTRPFQVIPFQWSIHTLSEDGTLAHNEYLHDGFDDPRDKLVEGMLKVLGDRGSIVIYTPYEVTQIENMARALPHMSEQLLAVLGDRIVDLKALVKDYYYHPEFHGSFSIKSVLPALVPELDYSDLEINDGQQASVAYAEMIRPETTAERRDQLRRDLLAYCKRDTEAEVKLFEVLSNRQVF